MRISVIVVTHNGARYVREQIRSILAQDRPADEVLVFDDHSSDDTAEIATEELEGQGILVRNAERLGLYRNVDQAVRAARGDVIVLADQDDIWGPEKLELVAQRFRPAPSLTLMFTDAQLVDGDGRPLNETLWSRIAFSPREQRRWRCDPLNVVLRRTVVTGATCAFRRELLLLALPFPQAGLHDAWLGLVAALHAKQVDAIASFPMRYRLHGANTAGLPQRTPWGRIGALRWPAPWILHHWQEALVRFPGADGWARLHAAEQFHRRRLALPDGRVRVRSMLHRPLPRSYLTMEGGPRALAWDLLAPRLFAERIAADRDQVNALELADRPLNVS